MLARAQRTMLDTIVILLMVLNAQANAMEKLVGRSSRSEGSMDGRLEKMIDNLFDRKFRGCAVPCKDADLDDSVFAKRQSGLSLSGPTHPVSRPQGRHVPSAISRSMAVGPFPAIVHSQTSSGSPVGTLGMVHGHNHRTVKAPVVLNQEKELVLEQAQAPVIAQLKLGDATRSVLAESFASLPVQYYDDIDTFEQVSSRAFAEALSGSEREAIENIFSATGPACIHITNLPVSAASGTLIPTPNELMEKMQPVHKTDAISEACLVGAAGLVGASCLTYGGFYGDDFVRNFPRKQGADLGWHRDGVTAPPFRPPTQFFRDEQLVPELVIIFCLRGNAEARTLVVDFARLVAASDKDDIALLRTQPLVFHDAMYGNTLEPIHVVKGTNSTPVVELRPIERFEVRGDERVIGAYRRIYDLAERTASSVTLSAGDMLIVNNKRCSHARTPYAAKEEAASDRWLQNVYASRRAELWDKEGQSYVAWPDRHLP